MSVEILFTAWNRRAYTHAALDLLQRNTNWSKVRRLVVYDDGSEDGTRELLESHPIREVVPAYELRHGGWNSTGATMNDYVARTEDDAEAFIKIDNDIAMPPQWLDILLATAQRNPNVELLGMEAGWTGPYQGTLAKRNYSVTPARHIGGVGLMRIKAFSWRRKPVPLSLGKNGRAGFTIWQHRYHLKAAWLTPDIPNVQFDRIPDEPWAELAERYVDAGWARAWEPYTDDMRRWWKWLPQEVVQQARDSLKIKSKR